MAVYAIGDIQGCYDDLLRLLEKIAFDPTADELWLSGDLVNRGPRSLDVLRFAMSHPEAVKVVLGNHDLHLLALLYGVRNSKPKDTLTPILEAPDREDITHWLRHRPLMHRDETLDCTMVHAGIPPQWGLKKAARRAEEVETVLRSDDCKTLLSKMYGNQPDLWTGKLSGYDRLRFIINSFTRMRYCTRSGKLDMECSLAPSKAPASLIPWYRHPKRKTHGERIVFGHWSTLGFMQAYGAIALDTGCVWGGKLTAICITPDTAEPALAQCVNCEGALAPGGDQGEV